MRRLTEELNAGLAPCRLSFARSHPACSPVAHPGKAILLLVEGAVSHFAKTVQPLLCLLYELPDVLGLRRHTFLDGKKTLV